MIKKYINLKLKPFFTQLCDKAKKYKIILEGHKFLTFANILSILLGILPCLYFLITFEQENKIGGLLFLVPIIFVYLTSLLSALIFKKFKILSRIFSFLLNTFTIIIFQLLIGFLILVFVEYCDLEAKCNQIKYYPMPLENIGYSERVMHFPHEIPAEATNPHIHVSLPSFFGSEGIYLWFNASEEYINKEIKKHSYVAIVTEKDKIEDYPYFYRFFCNELNRDGYTYYVINDWHHDNTERESFAFHYGIGVNKDKTQILYYYENPD